MFYIVYEMKSLLSLLKLCVDFLTNTPMEKVLNKFSSPVWLMKIVFLLMTVLGVHIKFLSSYMGR
jgi:hypothetical protein